MTSADLCSLYASATVVNATVAIALGPEATHEFASWIIAKLST